MLSALLFSEHKALLARMKVEIEQVNRTEQVCITTTALCSISTHDTPLKCSLNLPHPDCFVGARPPGFEREKELVLALSYTLQCTRNIVNTECMYAALINRYIGGYNNYEWCFLLS